MLASPKLQAVRNVINTVARSRPSSPTSPSRSSSPARFSTFEPSKTNVLLVSSSDTACMQRIRTRLAKDLGVNIAVELASSTPALDTAVSIHKPNLVFCMDDRAVRLMPPAVLTSDAVPCLTFTQPVGEAGQLLVQQPNAPMNTQSRVITGKVWESRPVGTPSPNSTRGSHHRTVLASTVSQTVVDIVRKRAAGMTVQGAAGEGRLIAYDDPTLASRLGDVDFGFSAEDVAARIQAAGAY